MAENSIEETLADQFLEAMRAGTAPWQKPWKAKDLSKFIARNPATGTVYKGSNALLLDMVAIEKYSNGNWMTLNQINAAGGRVHKGQRGQPILFATSSVYRDKLDANGKPILDDKGLPTKEKVLLDRPIIKRDIVFNLDQTYGVNIKNLQFYTPDKPEAEAAKEFNNHEESEKIIELTGATIQHGHNKASYSPSEDTISMPDKKDFKSEEGYYSTLFHEIGHWTGHESRLNREEIKEYSKSPLARAKEELTAEIFSYLQAKELKIDLDIQNHESYLDSWLKAIKPQDQRKELIASIRAATAANTSLGRVVRERRMEKEEYLKKTLEAYRKHPTKPLENEIKNNIIKSNFYSKTEKQKAQRAIEGAERGKGR